MAPPQFRGPFPSRRRASRMPPAAVASFLTPRSQPTTQPREGLPGGRRGHLRVDVHGHRDLPVPQDLHRHSACGRRFAPSSASFIPGASSGSVPVAVVRRHVNFLWALLARLRHAAASSTCELCSSRLGDVDWAIASPEEGAQELAMSPSMVVIHGGLVMRTTRAVRARCTSGLRASSMSPAEPLYADCADPASAAVCTIQRRKPPDTADRSARP